MTTILRSGDDAFTGLPGYTYTPHYVEFDGARMHYLDEGPRHGPVALLMHGMPTWSFLNRHILAALVGAGYRVIAADHIGFGKSDKPAEENWFSIARHAAAHRHLIQTLDITGITIFVQDWGGPIGLAQVAEMPERFDRLVIMNTWLHHDGYTYTPDIIRWQEGWLDGGFFRANIPERMTLGTLMLAALNRLPEGMLPRHVMGGEALTLDAESAAIKRAYDAPHAGLPDAGYAGPRRFPKSIPIGANEPDNAKSQAAHFATLRGWKKPVHFIWGVTDPIFTEAWGREWARLYPHATFDGIEGAGHFLQESHGAEVAARFLARTR